MSIESDPLMVFKGFAAAETACDVEAALAFFAENAILTNTRGRKFIGRENVRKFIEETTRSKPFVSIGSYKIEGKKLTVVDPARTDFYEKLGVAPVDLVHEIVVKDGKIISFINHLTPETIARLERAIAGPMPKDMLLFTESPGEFVRKAKAHTEEIETANARA